MNLENSAQETATNTNATPNWTKFLKVPHTYVILVAIILFAALLTYILPSGKYERVEDSSTGQTVVVPNSYEHSDAEPVSLLDIPVAIVNGFGDASQVIFFIFIVGGAFQIIIATGTIEVVTLKIANRFGKNEKLIIPVFLTLFSVGGFALGMSTETLVFVPIGVAVARALGYDAVVGMAMVVLGASCGFFAGLLNPFNVGVAQTIAELPLFSGMWLRAIILVVLLTVTSWYIMRYAKKVKENSANSLVQDMENAFQQEATKLFSLRKMELKHYLTITVLLIGFGTLFWGVSTRGWYITEISAVFLVIGIAAGFCAKFGPSKISSEFVKGASAITFGALIIGLARAVFIVLEQGEIIDTIVYSLSSEVMALPGFVQVLGIYFFQIFLNLFISSGTGQAAISMPIMVPLADLLDISRQTAVLAFQLGDGFTDRLMPTSSTTMGCLAVAGIAYGKWFKFMWKLVLIWIVIGAAFVLFADYINY